ncbi:hypothetical protein DFJ73DRAFT_836367 [Zopfochytrium polystomum]|nr:hypothetical protein DFJ73DRAFT_836367 [Zopfochytrium polystomum]
METTTTSAPAPTATTTMPSAPAAAATAATAAGAEPSSSSAAENRERAWRPFVFLPCVALLAFSSSLKDASQQQFLIQKICLSHYESAADSDLTYAQWNSQRNGTLRCDTPEVQQDIAEFSAISIAIAILPSLFTSIYIGYLTDIIGRKPIITTVCLTFSITVWAPYLVCAMDLPYQVFYLPSLCLGLIGGIAGLGSVGFATMVDLTTTSDRTRVLSFYVGAVVAMSLAGIAAGGAITGNPALGDFDRFLPVFRLSAVIATVGLFYVIFVTPETLPSKVAALSASGSGTQVQSSAASSSSSVPSPPQSLISVLPSARTLFQKFKAAIADLPLTVVGMQVILAFAVVRFNFDTQLSNYRFGWGTRETSLYSFVETIVGGVLAGLVLPTAEQLLRALLSRRVVATSAATTTTAATTARGDLETAAPLLPLAAEGEGEDEDVVEEVEGRRGQLRRRAAELAIEDAVSSMSENEKRKVTVKIHTLLIRFTLSGSIVGTLVFATATSGWMWFASLPLIGLSSLTSTCIRLIISEYVPPDQMALTNSVLGVIDSVVLLMGNLVAAQIYPHYYYMIMSVYAVVLAIALGLELKAPPHRTEEGELGAVESTS